MIAPFPLVPPARLWPQTLQPSPEARSASEPFQRGQESDEVSANHIRIPVGRAGSARLAWIAALMFVFICGHPSSAEYALRDGDTVVFLGDSITAARTYGKIIENYTLLRFPERKVQFINAGRGGETAKGSLERLEADVFARGATVVTVAYGVNDIGWGMKADEAHKQEYLKAVGELVDRCKARNVRVFICSAAITAEDPDKAEKGFLQRMCDEGLEAAKGRGAGTIDVQRSMRIIQRRIVEANSRQQDKAKHTRLHTEDGIHLNDLGQMAMAFSILKGLGAPSEVTSASIDSVSGKVLAEDGCRIADLKKSDDELTFTRRDERLPLNLHPLWMLQGIYIPIADELNRYMLSVKGLSEGRYEVTVDGRSLGKWKNADLDRGINIASATSNPWRPGGTWDVQGHAVKVFTDMRDGLVHARRDMERDMTTHPEIAALRQKANVMEKDLVELQRATARPVPFSFRVHKVAEKTADEAAATVPRDHFYGEVDGEKLGIDVYLPPANSDKSKRPAVLLIHGGGWVGGTRKDVANEARALAKHGYVAFSVTYRLGNAPARLDDSALPVRNRYPAPLDDCQRAVRWIRSKAAEFQIDPDRVTAIGWSAGGHLASLLGTLDTRDNSDPMLANYSSRVNGVINVFGPADLTLPLPETNLAGEPVDPKGDSWVVRKPVHWLADELVGSTNVDAQKAASPLHHIDSKTAPFLIVHGALDKLVPIQQSRAFHTALQAKGVEARLVEFPDEGHGFGKPDNQKRFAEEVLRFLDRSLNPNRSRP
jgi:acetyl esterase/lipase/lysophospholipase L1-like esterase